MEIKVNGKSLTVSVPDDMPLLWVIRDELNMTGTKYGCGMAQCGACTVYVDGEPVRSCVTPVSSLAGKSVTTIEGLDSKVATAVQQAWEDLGVPQCGWCQSGQVMAATALLTKNKKPTDADIDAALAGNICRCGTYANIRSGIHKAAENIG